MLYIHHSKIRCKSHYFDYVSSLRYSLSSPAILGYYLWASQRLVNPDQREMSSKTLDQIQVTSSVCLSSFSSYPNENIKREIYRASIRENDLDV